MSAPSTLCTVPTAPNGLEGWTSCCDAAVTYSDALGTGPVLCCKCCYEEVMAVPLKGQDGAFLGEVIAAVLAEDITPDEGVEFQRAILVPIS